MNPLNRLSKNAQAEIVSLINQGQKIAACKLYRHETGVGLKEAKDAVDEIAAQSSKFSGSISTPPQQKNGGCASLLAAFVAGILLMLVIVLLMPARLLLKLKKGQLDSLQEKVVKTSPSVCPSEKIVIHEKPAPPKPTVTAYPPTEIPENLGTDLGELYRQKLSNPDYVRWKNLPGLPQGYQYYPEEVYIKHARAQLAKNIDVPFDAELHNIPQLLSGEISVDGKIGLQEWSDASRISLEPFDSETSLYLQADDEWLYIAASVPGDRTEDGFDQLRFHFHVNLAPELVNERIHVGRSSRQALGGIRQTTVRWQGDPPENNDQRWKKYPISDWRIYKLAVGASTMNEYRQFEAKINLKEAGLFAGIPFAAFVEVETDPLYVDGKFKKRRYLGNWGSQQQPVWLQIK